MTVRISREQAEEIKRSQEKQMLREKAIQDLRVGGFTREQIAKIFDLEICGKCSGLGYE